MSSGKKLRVWILRQGEPVIFHPDMKDSKPMRAALLARELAGRGHEVIWWANAFQHFTKIHLAPAGITLRSDMPNLSYHLLPSPGYKRNVSLARYRDHAILARAWQKAVENEAPPDVIVAAFPAVDLAFAAVCYGLRHRVPVLVDVRDMWPDAIYERLRRRLRLAFLPRFLRAYERMTRHIFGNADGILGITDPFVEWGLQWAGRPRDEADAAFPLSSEPLRAMQPDERQEATAFWQRKLLPSNEERIIFSWVGTLSNTPTIRTFLKVVAALDDWARRRMRLVICGTGELERWVARLARRHEHILYAGWVNRPELVHLLSMSDYGVIPYERTMDLQSSIPNKVSEFLSAGVPVVTTLDGYLRQFLGDKGVIHFMPPDARGMREGLVQLLGQEKPSADVRRRAHHVYREYFDSVKVYAAMADHVERIAQMGKRESSGDAPA